MVLKAMKINSSGIPERMTKAIDFIFVSLMDDKPDA